MPKPLTPQQRLRLFNAWSDAQDMYDAGKTARVIIDQLKTAHGAFYGWAVDTYALRCCGVQITKSTGDASTMLRLWLAEANSRLTKAQAA